MRGGRSGGGAPMFARGDEYMGEPSSTLKRGSVFTEVNANTDSEATLAGESVGVGSVRMISILLDRRRLESLR